MAFQTKNYHDASGVTGAVNAELDRQKNAPAPPMPNALEEGKRLIDEHIASLQKNKVSLGGSHSMPVTIRPKR